MRQVALLLFCLLPACATPFSEKKDQLASYQRHAKLYYDGARYDQALGQIERGLELEPDDYMLNALRGTILLKTSESSTGTDHRLLDEATALLEKVFETRSANRHEPYLLLHYALARQKQGRRHLGEAIRQRDQATRAQGDAAKEFTTKAADEQALALNELEAARKLLDVLIDRGEVLRLAHYHQFQIALDLGDKKAADEHATAYLEQMAKEQEFLKKDIESTPNLAYERQQVERQRQMRNEELLARGVLAQMYYDAKAYEKARAMLDRILELDPSRSVDYYNRGRVLMVLGEKALAKADFRKFLATTDLPTTSDKTTLALRALDQ